MGLSPRSQEEIDLERKSASKKELLERLILFPGSVEEYANFRGYDVEMVDTERPDKGVFLSYNDEDMIVSLMDKKGVEALVNISYSGDSLYANAYGLPVKRKK